MYRSRDFYLKGIYNVKGKKLGIIKDLYIDFNSGMVKGFKVNNMSLLSKKSYGDIEDIINIDEDIIIEKLIDKEGLKFSDIKGMDVIDKFGNSRGVVDDILIDEDDFFIKGIIITSGLIDKMIKGKEIVLINRSLLAEDYILYLGEPNIVVKNIPHEMNRYEYCEKA